jgi:hypothetical protein
LPEEKTWLWGVLLAGPHIAGIKGIKGGGIKEAEAIT